MAHAPRRRLCCSVASTWQRARRARVHRAAASAAAWKRAEKAPPHFIFRVEGVRGQRGCWG